MKCTLTFENGIWCLRGPKRVVRKKSNFEKTVLSFIKSIKRVKRKHDWMKSKNTLNRHTFFQLFTK